MPPDTTLQKTLKELLEDPLYAQWFNTQPRQSWALTKNDSTPWRVWVQFKQGGKWYKREFRTWKKAHKFLARNLHDFYDAALNHRVHQSRPPVVRDPNKPNKRKYYGPMVKILGHRWCGYCRRPTVFAYFGRHHAFSGKNRSYCDPGIERCSICGASERIVTDY